MYDLRTNYIENKLFLIARGKINLIEVKTASGDILKNARKLRPGFVMISDVRELAPTQEEGRLELQNMMRTLKDLGMAAEIRIVADNNLITANQLQRTSRSVGYTAPQVHSLIEAERLIDEMG